MRLWCKTYFWVVVCCGFFCGFVCADSNTPAKASVYGYEIINSYQHDRGAFTQGLVFREGLLYESTGLHGKSELRKVKLETGEVKFRQKLARRYFGEGITVHHGRVIQLTWRSRKGFVYDSNTLGPVGTFAYRTEGWGITDDGKRLIMSDGTATLQFLDPNTFEVTGKLEVHDNNRPVRGLNELEYVRGRIYANVWKSDRIAVISAEDGRVREWIDLKGILTDSGYGKSIGVLNGIAYDDKNDRLFVTGKFWPMIFEIRVVRPN